MKNHINISFIGFLFALLLVSCNEEDGVTYQLNSKLVELKCGKSFTLEVSPTLSSLTYTSLNTNIATVTSSGVVKAGLVGSTKLVVKDSLNQFSDTVKVIVTSIHTIFSDLYLGFGADQFVVRDNLNLTYITTENIPEQTGFMLKFEGENEFVEMWIYTFDGDGKYINSKASVYESYYVDLESHLNDRYSYMTTKRFVSGSTNYVDAYYINPDSTVIVLDCRMSSNNVSTLEFHPATNEKIQLILSDANYRVLYGY